MNVLLRELMVCLVFRIPIVYPGTVVVSCLSNDVANAAKTRIVHPVKTASKWLIYLESTFSSEFLIDRIY